VPLAGSANTALSATSAENAQTADAAQSVGGVREHVVHVSAPNPAVGFTDTPVDSTGGMQTILRCQDDGTSGIVINGSASDDRGLIEGVAYGPGATAVAVNFSNSAAGVATNGALTNIGGSATMRAQSGAEVRFDFQVYESLNGFGTNDDCWVDGFVRFTP
jgi:hypothetical protein